MKSGALEGIYEAEVKVRITDPHAVISRITALGGVSRFLENTEDDICFDWPDARLAERGMRLILRERLPFGEILLMLKRHAPREVHLVPLASSKRCDALLRVCGFIEVARLHKIRSQFTLGHCHLAVDLIAGHGSFLEVGSMTDDSQDIERLSAEVESLINQLGCSLLERENRSYHDFAASVQSP